MKELLCVFVGGGAGSVLRYLIALAGARIGCGVPWATLLANGLGCLLIGVLGGWLPATAAGREWRLLLTVGFCGGFTTFSTFCNEALGWLRTGHYAAFFLYVAGSVCLGLAGVWLGWRWAGGA